MSGRSNLSRSTYIALVITAAILVLAMMAGIIALALRTTINDVSIPSVINLEKGGQIQLTPEYDVTGNKNEDAVAKAAEKLNLRWESSNEEVATVDQNGFVRSFSGGDAYITLSADLSSKQVKSICHIYVNVAFEEIFAPDVVELSINYMPSINLGAHPVPEDSTGVRLEYSSANPGVATVDANGTVTATGDGICSIIVSAVSRQDPSDVLEKIQVRVMVTTVPSSIQAENLILHPGEQGRIPVSAEPENADTGDLTYIVSNQSVCSVDNSGNATAISTGTSTVIISDHYGHTCSMQVIVTD